MRRRSSKPTAKIPARRAGRPSHTLVHHRRKILTKLLRKGYHPREIAARTGFSREFIYRFAKENLLPTNRPFVPGAHRFMAMCAAVASGVSITDVATAFRVSPAVIHQALKKGPPAPLSRTFGAHNSRHAKR